MVRACWEKGAVGKIRHLPVSRQIYKQFASELSTCMAKQRSRPVSHETGMLCNSHLAATRSGYPICLALAGL